MADNSEILNAIKSDDVDDLQRAVDDNWRQIVQGRTVLHAAWQQHSVTGSLVTYLLRYQAQDAVWCLQWETEHENVDFLTDVMHHNPLTATSDCGTEILRYAARRKSADFLEKLKQMCTDTWPDLIKQRDSTGRNLLHSAALAANLSSLNFLVNEFHHNELDLLVTDVNHKTFVDLLLDEHREMVRHQCHNFSLLHKVPLRCIDLPQLSEAMTHSEADEAVNDLMPSHLLLSNEQLTESLLTDAVAITGSCRLLRALLTLHRIQPHHLDHLDLLKLVIEGKLEVVKDLLVLRQSDIIEQSLYVYKTCDNLCQTGSNVAPNTELQDLRDFAYRVCLNTIDLVYDNCMRKQEEVIHFHMFADREQKSLVKRLSEIRNIFTTRCFAELVNRRWKFGCSYPTAGGAERIKQIFTPRVKFCLHFLSFFVFAALLCAYVNNLKDRWIWLDYCIIVYLVSFVFQEIHEASVAEKNYCNVYNVCDLLPLPVLAIGVVMKLMMATSVISTDYRYTCQVLLALSFLLFGLKFLYLMRVGRTFGPYINMLKTLIVDDLFPFLATVFGCTVICFGVFFNVLLNPNNRWFSPEGHVIVRNDTTYWNIYIRPLLVAFGKFELDSHQNCLDGEGTMCAHPVGNVVYVRAVIFIYVIVVNVLLMNLLIAKFSLTVSNKSEQSEKIWRCYQYEILVEYSNMNALPPPINIPWIIFLWFRRIQSCGSCCCCSQKIQVAVNADAQKFLVLQAVALRQRRSELMKIRCDEGNGVEQLRAQLLNITEQHKFG